jgi:PqqA peptide cyclase
MAETPLALIAELTHRCPLHCVYCSNPLALVARNLELETQDWLRVFEEARSLGILHLHLSGGEPLARADLTLLVRGAHDQGLYINLITSGVGLSRTRLAELVRAGVDHLQLSFQDANDEAANRIAGARAHAHKLEVADWIKEHPVAFTANLVVHRHNLDHLEEMIGFLEKLAPERIEVAHTQYYGWAFKNRAALLPTPTQIEAATRVLVRAAERLQGRIRLDWVAADYHARFPKPCMGGWGRRSIVVDPSGRALPCHAAQAIAGLHFANVRERSLNWIWQESPAFEQFRGEAWMQEPCRSCQRRHEDFGGCRCQAFLLTGDARATDPACSLSPAHHLIREAIGSASQESAPRPDSAWSYRENPRA